MYQIKLSRRSAALYLALDFGINRAVRELSKHKGFLVPVPGTYKRKREASLHLNRINMIVAFQQGRLGKRLTDTLARVEEIY